MIQSKNEYKISNENQRYCVDYINNIMMCIVQLASLTNWNNCRKVVIRAFAIRFANRLLSLCRFYIVLQHLD